MTSTILDATLLDAITFGIISTGIRWMTFFIIARVAFRIDGTKLDRNVCVNIGSKRLTYRGDISGSPLTTGSIFWSVCGSVGLLSSVLGWVEAASLG